MALTTIPSAGAKLRASVLSSLITEIRPLVGVKTSDQNVGPSNTVLTDVTECGVAVVANAVYEFRAYLQYSSNTTADVKFGFTGPVGAAMDYGFLLFNVSAVWIVGRTTLGISFGADGGNTFATCHGSFTTGANAGTFQLQAAQNTSTAVTTNVEAGTVIALNRVS
jgi:hypothetical protein